MLLSGMCNSIIVTLFAYRILSKNIDWKLFDRSLVVKILKYSIPLVPGAIALLMFSQSDKIILINYISKDELGIYTLAFTIGLSMAYIGSAFFMAYQPIFYEKLSKGLSDEIKNDYWKILLFLLLALLLAFLAIFVVYQFINIKYIEGFKLSLIIALAYCYVAFSQIMELHLTYMKRTSIVSIIYGLGGILTVSSLFILIPLMGMKGAALSLFLSALLISVLMYNIAQRYLFISYNHFYVVSFYLFTLSAGGFIIWI
jgi:O-antigen/teichoic acid export membrane protein